MTDVEHEFLVENDRLREELRRVRQVAVQALSAAMKSQDDATGQHEAWLESALQSIEAVDA